MSDVYFTIQKLIIEINSPYNDGWTSRDCKKTLYQLKCFIEDQYKSLPNFSGEEKWEQERIIDILKK